MADPTIRLLKDIGGHDGVQAGGKAVNLGEMIAAGLPVPAGFVVLTGAYRAYLHDCGLDARIREALAGVSAEDGETLECRAAEVRGLFEPRGVPEGLRREIAAAYAELGNGEEAAVAVRSSATAEDLPGMSFAGQYDSFLNVTGLDALVKRIVACWASLWNARALSYRLRQGIGNDELAHAVIVQRLVHAEKSGILFTANPLNGRRDQLLLNSSWGLGEAIVSGEVNPDQWVISRSDGAVVESRIGEKRIMTVRTEREVEHRPVAADARAVASLAPEELRRLQDLAEKAERHFGRPQDIEWAYAEGEFHLVQSRPITSLYPVPDTESGKPGVRIYINVNNYSQAMPEPFTAMGGDLVRTAIGNVRRRLGPKRIPENSLWYLKTAGGRLFIDITPFLRSEKFWNKFRKPDPADKDPVTTRALLQYLEANRTEVLAHRESVSYLKLVNPRLLRYLWRAWREYSYGRRRPVEARERAVASGDAAVARIREAAADLQGITERGITEHEISKHRITTRVGFLRTYSDDVFLAGAGTLFGVAASSGYVAEARALMEQHLGDAADLHLVEKAVPHSVTTEMGMELMACAEDCAGRGVEPSTDDPAIRRFIAKYGHKKAVELDAGTPTWAEKPEYVLDLVRAYMENELYRTAAGEFERNRREAEAAIDRIYARFVEAGRARQGRAVRRLLRDFREMFGVREQSKFVITQGLEVMRNVLHDIGAELASRGSIDTSDDVFHLTLEDIESGADTESGADLRAIAAVNREAYRRNASLRAPRLLTSLGETIYAASYSASELGDSGNGLTGVAVSPGVAEGRVRVLTSHEEGHTLQPGEILVTVGTNPSWTPLFLRISGLIMECGGPISHGSVVAREYGVPAVSGIPGATQTLRTGQRVRLNGETGEVQLLDEVDEEHLPMGGRRWGRSSCYRSSSGLTHVTPAYLAKSTSVE